ncbi:hypothetical protein UFOVP23_35 [uncultured Caudovirales phage]|uniref:Major capsid protein Gp5 n=1 Tax=uncultured Caudovirales phage TaxID=2100421 RepID=A0A6J5T8B4_9CAUD|nr:hypothetical protein UFOVP23_35 [uncultured Caudovirales phage]
MDITAVKQIEYDAYVHAVFQSTGGLLDNTFRERMGVIGNTEQFRVSSQVVATQKAPQAALTPLNMVFTPVLATLAPWSAPDFVNIFEETDINFAPAREVADGCVKAIKRRRDQIRIDALDASATANTIANGGTGFTYVKFEQAIFFLAENSAGRGQVTLAISAAGQRQLMAEEQITNQFYVNYKPIAGSGLDGATIQNVKIILIPNMLEGGLPIAGNIRTCFMWNWEAVGAAESELQRTDMQWQGLYECWLINCRIKAGAVAVDNTGIVKIDIDETV